MAPTLSSTTGANIRAELARRGLPQRSLARHLGLSTTVISKRLSGATPIDVNELEVIAEFLGMTVAELLGKDAA